MAAPILRPPKPTPTTNQTKLPGLKAAGTPVRTPVNVKTGGKAPAQFNPLTSTFGLNVASKAPFNPLSPGNLTVGQFNKQVLQSAQPQYLPQLQQNAAQISAENAANRQRVGDIGQIYNQYQSQAQQAYNQVQQSLNNLIAQNNPGASQGTLMAAIQSAQGGQNALAQMTGQSTPPAAGVAPLAYQSGANAAQAATQQELNALAANALTLPGQNLADVGLERATEQNTESIRHQGAIGGFQQARSDLVAQIPGIIEKAREQLVSDMQNAQSLQFQENLANKQFGLSSQQQQFNQAQTAAQFKETQLNDASNRQAQLAQIQQNAQSLANQEAAAATTATNAADKLAAQTRANVLKDLAVWLKPTAQDLIPTSVVTTDPNTGQRTTTKGSKLSPTWHKDVGTKLRQIMDVYKIPLSEALQLMADAGGNVPISGNGGQTVAQWALTFNQRSQPPARVGSGVTSGAKNVGSKLFS
jgi:hypothetical protein